MGVSYPGMSGGTWYEDVPAIPWSCAHTILSVTQGNETSWAVESWSHLWDLLLFFWLLIIPLVRPSPVSHIQLPLLIDTVLPGNHCYHSCTTICIRHSVATQRDRQQCCIGHVGSDRQFIVTLVNLTDTQDPWCVVKAENHEPRTPWILGWVVRSTRRRYRFGITKNGTIV